MAERKRMTADEVVSYLLEEDGADLLRESLKWVVQQLMEAEAEVLPYCREHDIGVLIYGPLAHGLLTGALDEDTAFAADDWRSGAPFFRGDAYRRNMEVVRELGRFASEWLGVSVSRLVIAWTLANPAVHVVIVGARHPGHIEDSVAAAELNLSGADLEQIDRITADSVPL